MYIIYIDYRKRGHEFEIEGCVLEGLKGGKRKLYNYILIKIVVIP